MKGRIGGPDPDGLGRTLSCPCLFFFFQAEDGIRDLTVTGVQTCALPIFRLTSSITGKRHLEFTAATELANAITREGKIPYRDAYRMVGQAVGLAVKENRRLDRKSVV